MSLGNMRSRKRTVASDPYSRMEISGRPTNGTIQQENLCLLSAHRVILLGERTNEIVSSVTCDMQDETGHVDVIVTGDRNINQIIFIILIKY